MGSRGRETGTSSWERVKMGSRGRQAAGLNGDGGGGGGSLLRGKEGGTRDKGADQIVRGTRDFTRNWRILTRSCKRTSGWARSREIPTTLRTTSQEPKNINLHRSRSL